MSCFCVRDVAQPFLGPLAEAGIVLIFTVFLLVEENRCLRNRIFRLAGLNGLNVIDASRGRRGLAR